MQSDLDVDLAERYRKEAGKFADRARTALPGVFRNTFKKTAVRYLRMARELERQRSEPAHIQAGVS
jgi:alkylhydroperoxidase family enzyme